MKCAPKTRSPVSRRGKVRPNLEKARQAISAAEKLRWRAWRKLTPAQRFDIEGMIWMLAIGRSQGLFQVTLVLLIVGETTAVENPPKRLAFAAREGVGVDLEHMRQQQVKQATREAAALLTAALVALDAAFLLQELQTLIRQRQHPSARFGQRPIFSKMEEAGTCVLGTHINGDGREKLGHRDKIRRFRSRNTLSYSFTWALSSSKNSRKR